MPTIWPDDVENDTSRLGTAALLGGRLPYFVSTHAWTEIHKLEGPWRAAVTRHILEDASAEEVEINTYNLPGILARAPLPVGEKIRRVLRTLAAWAQYQVKTVFLAESGNESGAYRLCREAGLEAADELRTILDYHRTRGHIIYSQDPRRETVQFTLQGLLEAEKDGGGGAPSQIGFIAMWFDPEVQPAFELGIAPGIDDAGFLPLRLDKREHNNRIDDEIIAGIRGARFVVADFSHGAEGARGGVYFEAGFALALGKQVIFTVRKQDLDKVHFDTRQFNYIDWDDPADLRVRLKNRITATIPLDGV